MSRPRKVISIDEAIERLEAKAVTAAANSSATGKATSALLNIGHHLYALQMIKALSSTDPVAGQTLAASQRFLAANSVKRTPGFDDDSADGADNYAAHLDKLSAGLDLPYPDDGSDIEDYNILEDNSK